MITNFLKTVKDSYRHYCILIYVKHYIRMMDALDEMKKEIEE